LAKQPVIQSVLEKVTSKTSRKSNEKQSLNKLLLYKRIVNFSSHR
jgi:hypothetical protein